MIHAVQLMEFRLSVRSLDDANLPITREWRNSARLMRVGQAILPGQAFLSYSWLAPEHRVSPETTTDCDDTRHLLNHTQGPRAEPAPSVDTQTEEAHQWMAAMAETCSLLDGILAIVHPSQFDAARDMLGRVVATSGIGSIESLWPSVYHAVQLVINRETLYHRDVHGRPGWLDMLVTLGTYGERALLALRNLGVGLTYDAGTVVMIDDRLVVHGVPPTPGDRICYAFFMNRHVMDYSHVYFPDWTFLPEALRP